MRLSINDINNNLNNLDENYRIIDSISSSMLLNYTKDVDVIMDQLKKIIDNPQYPLTDEELERAILKLSSILYFLNNAYEQAGIRFDLAELERDASFREHYSISKGTVQERQNYANSSIEKENISCLVYKRVYTGIKNRINAGTEMLSSLKKILSKRMNDTNYLGKGE